jgi:YD repeat-containing protein
MTMTRQSGSNFVTAVVDGLSRRTEHTYDSAGHVLTTTRLAGTSDAVTTTYTCEPTFFQVATVTDPLGHTWAMNYNAGRLTGVTDPLSHQTAVSLNAAGQVTSVSDALGHTWQYGYSDGALTSTTDPLNATWTQFVDAGGRVIATTDPIGRVTRKTFDRLNRATTISDPVGNPNVARVRPERQRSIAAICLESRDELHL